MDSFPTWFESARLNFAENALWCKDPSKTAIIATGELQSTPTRISYAELYARVRQCAKAMRKAGVVKGDRVAGYIANCPEAIIAMLAASSIGAIWSSTSPDFGTIVRFPLFSSSLSYMSLFPSLFVFCLIPQHAAPSPLVGQLSYSRSAIPTPKTNIVSPFDI